MGLEGIPTHYTPSGPQSHVAGRRCRFGPSFLYKMNEGPNLTLEMQNICTHTIAFERTKNQVKRTINECVMVGNSFCKHKDSATFRPDLETIMPPANLFLTITRSIPDRFA